MKTTELYLCECGRVFDDWETYDNIPRYGKEKKPLRGIGGRIVMDGDNIVYQKCHICRKALKGEKTKRVGLISSILSYLKDHDFITTDTWREFGFHTRQSMSSTLNNMVCSGSVKKHGKYSRPQKYYKNNLTS
jgi:hypothetical protein